MKEKSFFISRSILSKEYLLNTIMKQKKRNDLVQSFERNEIFYGHRSAPFN